MIYFGERVEVGEPAEPFDFFGMIERLKPPWMADGACIDYPHDWFFPERGCDVARAQSICDGCSVKAECLEYGMGEHHGIWGGTSERERRRMRRRRNLLS